MQFARVVRYRKGILIATLTIAALLGGLYYSTAKRAYQAKASLLVLQTGAETTGTAMSAEGVRQGLMPTYERLFTSAVVLEGAIRYLDPTQRRPRRSIARQVAAYPAPNLTALTQRQTNIIEVAFRSKTPAGRRGGRQRRIAIVPRLHGADPQRHRRTDHRSHYPREDATRGPLGCQGKRGARDCAAGLATWAFEPAATSCTRWCNAPSA